MQENDMAKQDKPFIPQAQESKPPHEDAVAMQKQRAEEKEVAGRHKNDGQNDHQGNRRQPGRDRGKG
ncbi:MAG: hypothetical protein H0X11_00005 [Betaproteobacteria bacterium]|nr:hypothetical protein [Betaproteobacteria bacterium]